MRELLRFAAYSSLPAVALGFAVLLNPADTPKGSSPVEQIVAIGGSPEAVARAGVGATAMTNGSAGFPPRAVFSGDPVAVAAH